MELLERTEYLKTLNNLYNKLNSQGGHTIFILGEGGIGKSSLIDAFIKQLGHSTRILKGGCDFLFTPRPLGPLYDMVAHFSDGFKALLYSDSNKSMLFSAFLNELKSQNSPIVLIFEDIHWADEATLDLIKFLSRRVNSIYGLFIVSFRENEITHQHLFKTIYGEIPRNLVTKLKLKPLSEQAVKELAEDTNHDYKEVYRLTKGNPFYVTEILASYSDEIPENVKDTVLNVYYKQNETVRHLWEMISIFPGKVNYELIEEIEPDFYTSIENSIAAGILLNDGKHVFFKHELFRTAIENEISALNKIRLNQKVLDHLLSAKTVEKNFSLIVHFAKNSQNGEIVEKFAPLAAKSAALQGSHSEASKLYLTAIEYHDTYNENLGRLYENAAYECYLTNQITKAIEAQKKALEIWKKFNEEVKIATSLRFLSRLNWFNGKREEAERFGIEAIEAIKEGFPISVKALAYSNYSQLKMLSFEKELAIEYGEKAIKLATEIGDKEILCHALNNVGAATYQEDPSGLTYLQKSLSIAKENDFQEHVARAYTNMVSISIEHKDYEYALKNLNEALVYCVENDLYSWNYYMLVWKARYHFELCEWAEAESIVKDIVSNPYHPAIIRMGSLTVLGRLLNRKGNFNGITYLQEAIDLAIDTNEIQRVLPLTIALLEYEWMTQDHSFSDKIIYVAQNLLKEIPHIRYYSELVYWLIKTKRPYVQVKQWHKLYEPDIKKDFNKAAEQWKSIGCKFEYALSIYQMSKESNYEALEILDEIGAKGALEFLKQDLRSKGVKNIPRGKRETTKNNPANLTNRQIDVLRLLKDGLTNLEIADSLFISAKTVDHHVSAILSKLEVDNRQKAVAEAEKLGILKSK